MQVIPPLFKNEDNSNRSSNSQSRSILNKSLAHLIGLSSDDINALWDPLDLIRLESLALSEKDWNNLRRNNFFKSDTLSVLLSFSVNYLLSLNISEKAFDEIMRFLKFSSEQFLGKKLEKPHLLDLDDSPILNSKYVKFIEVIDEALYKTIDSLLSNSKPTKPSTEMIISEKLICENLGISLSTFKIISNLKMYNTNLTNIANEEYNPFNYKNLYEMLRHFLLTEISVTERDQQILFTRIGYPDNQVMTLEETGILFDVSRERIRQILGRISRKLAKLAQLRNCQRTCYIENRFFIIKKFIDFHIRKNGGMISFELLGNNLRSTFYWDEHPGALLLIVWVLLGYTLIYESEEGLRIADRGIHKIPHLVDISKVYFVESTKCERCKKIIKELDENLAKNFSDIYYETDFDDFSKRVKALCRSICDDNEIPKPFLRYKILESKEFKILENKIYNLNAWQIKYGSQMEIVESFLKIHKKPLHFSRFTSEIQKYTTPKMLFHKSKDIDRSIHAIMDRSKKLLLWDRGTYIHKDNVKIPHDLIKEISEWIKRMLSNGLPYISVSGVFDHFESECLQRNIPTESALYSCLRVCNDKDLIFPRYPKIALKHHRKTISSLNLVVEDYIKVQGKEVSYDEIKSYVIEKLLYKEFQLQQALGKLKRVLRTHNNGFIHYDNLNLNLGLLNEIIEYLHEVLKENEHTSIEKIFRDRMITCKRLGMDSGRMLYSLLSNETDDFYLPRYPIVLKESNENSKIRNIKNEVIEYIKNSKKCCSYRELEKEFVSKRGYEKKHVFNNIASGKIVKYTSSSVIHIDNINWTLEKEKKLMDAAEKEFYRATNSNHKYASLKEMLECTNLPELSGELIWTSTLLGNLLEKTGKFKVFGAEKQYFMRIPNRFGIFKLSDLIFQILKEEYLRAAKLDEFSTYLAQKGLIKKKIPKDILNDPRVFVDTAANIIKWVG